MRDVVGPGTTGRWRSTATFDCPRRVRIPWATLLERVFLIDVLRCDGGGRRRVLAMIRDPSSIERLLTHLGLPTGFPPRGPPRGVPGSLSFSASE